jgi:hypothetical protein
MDYARIVQYYGFEEVAGFKSSQALAQWLSV